MTELSNAFVCIMGMGTVFIGLICIVVICMLMSAVIKAFSKNSNVASAPVAPVRTNTVALDAKTKAEIIAGACACIAEELGEDASNIKVVSFKQI